MASNASTRTGKKKTELYREKLTSHFVGCTVLLDSIVNDYCQFYQHLIKNFDSLLLNQREDNPFWYRLTEAEANNN
ncbi:ZapG family protein [Candidatus Doolittlea endobia]|uniref:ZapG family protein n=1 Tax=Candidatus Doolittlea endobia TaxID=1778262 RepID=UPI00087074FE|nr:DUF1043 family protein [Candidatus Doolittlea endobia]